MAEERLSSPAGVWISKLSLRVCSLLFCVVVIAMSAFYASQWTIGPVIMMTPPAIVAILWDIVESVVLCVRRGHHGVPYACIVLDLILTLGLGGASILTGVILSKLSDSGYYIAYYQDEIGSEYLRIPLAFGLLATLIHMSIFFMAIYEIKQRKKQKTSKETQPQVIYVQTGPNGEVLSSSAPMGQIHHVSPAPMEPPPMYSPAEASINITPAEMPHGVGGMSKHDDKLLGGH